MLFAPPFLPEAKGREDAAEITAQGSSAEVSPPFSSTGPAQHVPHARDNQRHKKQGDLLLIPKAPLKPGSSLTNTDVVPLGS